MRAAPALKAETAISGLMGSSYGSSMPVKFLIRPARACEDGGCTQVICCTVGLAFAAAALQPSPASHGHPALRAGHGAHSRGTHSTPQPLTFLYRPLGSRCSHTSMGTAM